MTDSSPNQADAVLGVTKKWKHNRSLYPGWLVTPHRNRNRLHELTKRWERVVLRALPSLSFNDRLFTLDELNWRLERALATLSVELAAAIEQTLSDANPFSDFMRHTNVAIPLQSTVALSSPPADICDAWTRLAFSVLRFQREERQAEAFTKWATHLADLAQRFPSLLPQLCFERAMRALEQMDEVGARAAIASWPDSDGDVFWNVRKAAILIELGELRQAESVALAALRSIRFGIRKDMDDIYSYSREAWAIRLLLSIRQHDEFRQLLAGLRDPSQQKASEQYYLQDRREVFDRMRCEPTLELNAMEQRLRLPPPHEAPKVEREMGFQPGVVKESHRIGYGFDSDDDPRLAHEYMRFIEEAANPTRCGRLSLAHGTLSKLFDWFVRFDPVRTQTLILKLASTDVIESFLNRHRIAALSDESIAELHEVSTRVIDSMLAESMVAESASSISEPAVAEARQRRWLAAVAILSRIVIRLPTDKLDDELQRAMSIYRLFPKQHHEFPKAISALLQSILPYVSSACLLKRLPELVALPIAGSSGFEVAVPEDFAEPLVERLRDPAIVRPSTSSDWDAAIDNLLRMSTSTIPEVRGRALTRLCFLQDASLLAKKEQQRLGDVLWNNASGGTDIPEIDGLRRFAILTLPEPRKGIAERRLKQKLLSGEIPCFGTREIDSEGKVRFTRITMFVDPDGFFRDAVGATPRPFSVASPERRWLKWTQAEAGAMFGKVSSWWNAEGRDLLAQTKQGRRESLAVQPLRARIRWIMELLLRIVVPVVRQGTELARSVLAFVDETRKAGAIVESVLPALLKLDPLMAGTVAHTLRRAISSIDEDRLQDAMSGIRFWLMSESGEGVFGAAYRLPPCPDDLMHEIGVAVGSRRQPGLAAAIKIATEIVQRVPDRVDSTFIGALTLGLEYLVEETSYRLHAGEGQRVPYELVPETRRLAAELAVALHGVKGGRTKIVEAWIEMTKKDRLPEVRKVARQVQ